jgi:hypothetical protein
MRLYAWRRPGAAGAAELVAEILVTPHGARLAGCRDEAVAQAMDALIAEPTLPRTVRRMVGGARHVSAERLAPQDAEYWRALAEGLGRKTGCLVTDSPEPPQP